MVNNPVFYSRTKHIAIHHHSIHEMVVKGNVELKNMKTIANIADKVSLLVELLQKYCVKAGIQPGA